MNSLMSIRQLRRLRAGRTGRATVPPRQRSRVYFSRHHRSPLAAGFTLIELLLVMVIIAILAAVVVPKLTGRSKQAQVAAATADVSSLSTALNAFEVDNGSYPTSEQGLAALTTNPGNLTTWKGPYVEKVPNDPWGTPYVYRCPGTNGKSFDLLSCGPDKVEGGGDDITN